MAKGSAMGLWKGKKGSTVFYKIWNSNNKETQGEREYQANVRNPQSNGQADQRARMQPAQQIKMALSPIVSRSFQGIEYGPKSRLYFLKNALQLSTGYPYVEKGFMQPVPGEYLISKGSLGNAVMTAPDPTLSVQGFSSSLITDLEEILFDETTIAEISADLLANNANLKEGDQITFIGCNLPTAQTILEGDYQWHWLSFYLNTADTTLIGDLPGYNHIKFTVGGENSRYTIVASTGYTMVAAAYIISRDGEDGQKLRSTGKIAVSGKLDGWFDGSQRAITRASYQSSSSSTRATDWPVDNDDDISGANIVDMLYTLSALTGDLATLNGQQVRAKYNEDLGEYTAVYVQVINGDYYPVNANNARLSYTVRDPETQLQEVKFLTTANVPDLADLYKIVV